MSSKKIQNEVISLLEECYKTARHRVDKIDGGGRMAARATAKLFSERIVSRPELLEAAIEGVTLTAARNIAMGRPVSSWIEFIDDDEKLHWKAMSKQPQRLGHLFDELNRKYFGGKLRKRPVRWAAWKREPQDGLCTPRAIYIRRGISSECVAQTLVHEMCHIGTGKGHGKRFNTALARVKAIGAPIYPADLASNYYDPHKELPSTIENIAMERSLTTWRQVRKALASELVRSQAEVERRYPWARKRWMRKRAEFEANERAIEALRKKLAQRSGL